jgi:hypothetical protein
MKYNGKLLIILSLVIAAVTVLCSCQVNTSSTGTKYKYVMIGGLSDVEEQTVNGAIWRSIKEYQKKSIDESTNDKLPTIKYFTPASVSGSDSKSYSEAFTEAAKKQIELAAAGGAEVIFLPSDAYSDAYLSIKDNSKNFGNINFIILTVPGSKTADVVALNGKTTSIVLETIQYGYVFGYVLTATNHASIGYIGAEGRTSEDFITGIKKGCKAASEAKGAAEPSLETEIITVGPNEAVISEKAASLCGKCDVVIGDEMTNGAVKKAAADAGKQYASIYEDEGAVMSFSLDCDVLTGKLTSIITECRQRSNGYVMNLGVESGIFKLNSALPEEEANALLSSVAATAK